MSTAKSKLHLQLTATLRAAGLTSDAEVQATSILGSSPDAASNDRCLALAALDIDQIQRTVLASPRPVTIFGTSLLIADWDRAIGDLHHGLREASATVIFSGGGNALLLLPKAAAATLLPQLALRFNQRVHSTLTTAWIEVSPKELATPKARNKSALKLPVEISPRGFLNLIDALQLELRKEKHKAKPHSFLQQGPLHAPRCNECTVRPRDPASKDRTCRACGARKEYGRQRRKDERLDQAQSYEDLFGAARGRQRRLAYICIDGRGIGALLSSQTGLSRYHELSHLLHRAFDFSDEARRIAVGLQDQPDIESGGEQTTALLGRSYQLILCGGDDLLLVVPASGKLDAFTLTNSLIDSIERTFDGSSFAGQVKVGVGILITKNLGADYCFRRAQDLCKQAKSRRLMGAASSSAISTSSVSIELLLDGSAADQTLAEEHEAAARSAGPAQILRAHAYTKAQFTELLAAAKALLDDGVAASQLSHLRQIFEEDRPTAVLTLLYQAARDEKLRKAILGERPLTPESLPEFVLRPRTGYTDRFETAIPDLIDITRTMTA